jgi:perosamine synthetase
MYTGARPVYVDSEPDTWNIDPEGVAAAITPSTRGILAVHLYGHPAEMDRLRALADSRGLFLLEDAAQAHGASYRGRAAGSLGDISTFSFFGGKIITTGEGGMCLTDDEELATLMRSLRDQGQDASRRYVAAQLGFNYRMTNIAAAIGLAQVECADRHFACRHASALGYRERLDGRDGLRLQARQPWAQSADWLTSVILAPGVTVGRDRLIDELEAVGIETRPLFPPLHGEPVYASGKPLSLPVCERLGASGLSLPSGPELTEAQADRVCEELLRVLAGRLTTSPTRAAGPLAGR